jgi:DNA-binding transcriptional LysR family regulator
MTKPSTARAIKALNVRAMEVFREIVRTGSVTIAAQKAGLTQPAASRLIAQLETDIGFELFYRNKGRLSVSPDGQLLYDEVVRSLDSLERVRILASDIAEFRAGQLRIVAPPSLLEGALSDIAADFLKLYPKVRLTLESGGVESIIAMIASRGVDAGFVKLPIERYDLNAISVLKSGTVCVIPSGHPLALLQSVDAAALRHVPLILLGLGTSYRAQVEAAFTTAGVIPTIRVETHTISSACALVARGVGVAIVNHALAKSYVRDEIVLLPFVPDIRQEYAFVTADTPPSRLATAFLDCCKAAWLDN